MKRIIALCAALLISLSLVSCEGEDSKELIKQTEDLAGKYGKYIEDHKDEVVAGLDELSKIAQEQMDKVSGSAG